MAETGKEILDQDKVSVNGSSTGALGAFSSYYDILNKYRDRLAACGVDFSSLPERTAAKYNTEYHKEDDIQLGAIRRDGELLKKNAKRSGALSDLVSQTETIGEDWSDIAGQAAKSSYKSDKQKLDQGVDELHGKADTVTQVADSLQRSLEGKRTSSERIVDQLINTALHNNPGDFDKRLRTACESMEAGNKGGGIGGFGTNQHLYARQGGDGANWSASDVRKDIQDVVVAGFAAACGSLAATNRATADVIKTYYQTLLEALGVGSGSSGASYKKVTMEQLKKIFTKGNFASLPAAKQQEILDQLNTMMEHAGINTPKRQAAFLATCAVESGELTMWYEGAYPGGPDTDWFNAHYGPRTEKGQELGNTQPGDGARFKGRGPIQVTGRNGYANFTTWYNSSYHPSPPMDFTKTPELLEKPEYGFAAAEWFWTSHGVNAAADKGGIDAVTDIVNYYDDNRAKKAEIYNQALPVLGG